MKKPFILFDFDGVIADSFGPAFEVQKMACPHLTEEDYRRRFDGNINEWNKNSEKHTDECIQNFDFFGEYIPRMKNQIMMVDGMGEVIRDFCDKYTLIIISSTITNPIKEFLQKNNLDYCFTEIMGNDFHKSKIEKIKIVFEKYKTIPEECVFVTDTLGDILEAKHVGVKTIGVNWGFHKPETLMSGEPFELVDRPEELYSAVGRCFI
ncbi:MAG: HAD hydrolase-like protein [Candidatus Paceibacterota bacterium]|jgi:phosphoglycolate phosphatase